MHYTKKELKQISSREFYGNVLHSSICTQLIDKVTKGENLNIAENNFACQTMMLAYNEKDQLAFNIEEFENCANYIFDYKYKLYFDNLDCCKPAIHVVGMERVPIELSQRLKDKDYLERQYKEWQLILEKNRQKNSLIAIVSAEVFHHIKNLNYYCKNRKIGYFRRKYLEKSIVLNSKLVYLTVLEYHEEYEEEKVFQGINSEILIDSFSFVHVLFRHYSPMIKEYIVKSFHQDLSINYLELPIFFEAVIKSYFEHVKKEINNNCIYFEKDKIKYAIWFRKVKKSIKGKGQVEFNRVQSFYPITDLRELKKIQNYSEIDLKEIKLLIM